MIAAGAAFFIKNVTRVLTPAYSPDILLAPMFLNVVVVAIWMLVRGVDRNEWDRAMAGACCPVAGAGVAAEGTGE
jgi:hypothetical protein